MAGYSGTPLPRKLGIKAGQRVALIEPPASLHGTLGELPPDVYLVTGARQGDRLDVVLLFVGTAAELRRRFAPASRQLVPNGALWIGWPKKASKVPTDLTENVVREIGLAAGLVDVKVCAIDDVWSGLKFVRRVADRRRT